MYKESVCAVIVTYNRLEMLKECIMSLRNQTHALEEIIVINNSSTDGTSEWLGTQKDLTVITQENSGSAGGQYTGIKTAYEKGHDWIWCLEDDIYLTAECLSQLISHREKRLLIPLRLNSTGKVNDFTAIIYDLHTPFHKEVRRGTVNSVFTSGYKSPEMHEVQEFTFEGLLINRTIVQEIGLPKRDLFIFGDDTEYALRIRYKLGEKIFLVPKARVIRKINETLRTRYEWRDFYLERNTQYCILAYGENSKFKIVQLLVRNILFSYRCLVKASGKNKFCFPVVVLYDIIKNRNHFPQRFLPPTNKLSK